MTIRQTHQTQWQMPTPEATKNSATETVELDSKATTQHNLEAYK